jgi:hypothetical protein
MTEKAIRHEIFAGDIRRSVKPVDRVVWRWL